MALILIATPGATDANSLTTIEKADAYHEAHLYAASWLAATEETKKKALVMATRVFVARVRWKGTATTTTQRLPLPRTGLYDPNTGALIPEDEIPWQAEDATAEMARALIEGNRTADSQVDTQGLKRLKAGTIELDFRDFIEPKVLPGSVLDLLHGFLVSTGAHSVNVPLLRV